MNDSSFRLYAGTGVPIEDRDVRLPPFERAASFDDPAGYLADPGLVSAVNVALALGQPLLVTGEPGTGKTQLAAAIAHELALLPPLVFYTKSTSTARDLFYRYDALAHFRDSHLPGPPRPVESYITFEALGLAIHLSLPPEQADPYLPEPLRGRGPLRSVVLVDEIDKAPRDLPNDLLNELENAAFTVSETGETFTCGPGRRPIMVLTSNSEKNLPDAFLRRCVFYHIPFPEGVRLRQIIQRRVPRDAAFTPAMLESAVNHFEQLRDLALRKKPATAELLAWIAILEKMELDVAHLKPGEKEALGFTYSVLAKSKEDLEEMQRFLHGT